MHTPIHRPPPLPLLSNLSAQGKRRSHDIERQSGVEERRFRRSFSRLCRFLRSRSNCLKGCLNRQATQASLNMVLFAHCESHQNISCTVHCLVCLNVALFAHYGSQQNISCTVHCLVCLNMVLFAHCESHQNISCTVHCLVCLNMVLFAHYGSQLNECSQPT